MVRLCAGFLFCLVMRADGPVEQDLLARASAALDGLHHAESRQEADGDRKRIIADLEKALAFDRASKSGMVRARVYSPTQPHAAVPAIVLVRPHEDPGSAASHSFAELLVKAGFVVIVPDLRADHDRTDLLATGGFASEVLLQRDLRAVVDYLYTRDDVDRRRLSIVGSGLSALLTVALDARISATALDSIPDLRVELGSISRLNGPELPDPCLIVYGLLRIASSEDVAALVAPRQLLITNAPETVADHLSRVYRWYGAEARIRQLSCERSFCEQADLEWLTTALGQNPQTKVILQETEIAVPQRSATGVKAELTERNLNGALGEPLPDVKNGWALQATALPQEVTLTTQPGIAIPGTVLRPGPDGGGSAAGFLLCLFDSGRQNIMDDDIVQSALRRGWFVWVADVRGLGTLRVEHGGVVFACAALLGENLAWRQCSDARRILACLSPGSHTHRTAIYARGQNASIIAAYIAATASPDLPAWLAVRDGGTTFSDHSLPQYLLPMNYFDWFDLGNLFQHEKIMSAII